MSVSLFLKTIVATSEMDAKTLSEVAEIVAKVKQDWPVDTLEILKLKNPDLLAILQRTENQISSLVDITNMPPQVKREYKKTLCEYEKVGALCGSYAKRHTKTK